MKVPPAALGEWNQEIAQRWPHLSKSQAYVLALWSLGMVLARSCSLTAVALFHAQWLGRQLWAVRQQLREFCYDREDKRGQQRQQLEVEGCFAGLLKWVLSLWQGSQLALALDASSLGARFVVLAISVVYRGCAIPVAWKILPAGEPHAWRREWLRLLRQLGRAIPRSRRVIVLADRGLYARWLFHRIVRLRWHPFLRINLGGKFRPEGEQVFQPLKHLVPGVGTSWKGRGTAFVSREHRLDCTLLACWEQGHEAPWLILTDLPPEAAEAGWYGLRAWIEQGFKITKRGGWQWHRTRMSHPQRAARLWLAIAVATLQLLRAGGVADSTIPESTLPDIGGIVADDRRRRRATRLRLISVFRRGWVALIVSLLQHTRLVLGALIPEPWPNFQTAPT